MNNIDISVVIPVYNAEQLINRCLDSIFAQLGERNIEVILVDDGSSDGSVEQINKRREQNKIRLFRQKNSGPAKARNKGIKEAKGKYIAFIDADDYWLPGFIENTSHFLDEHPECIAVSVAQRHITIEGDNESPKNWQTLAPNNGSVIEDFYSFWGNYNHICTGSILIRTDIVKNTGGLREDLRICEDLEFWALIATYGKIGYIPKLLFVSDGLRVTEKVGWVKKHLPRWTAAMSIEDWQMRIIQHCGTVLEDSGFIKARGRIARNLAYSILLSKRYQLAKDQIIKFGSFFPEDKMTKLLRFAVKNSINWLIISRILVYREYHRK